MGFVYSRIGLDSLVNVVPYSIYQPFFYPVSRHLIIAYLPSQQTKSTFLFLVILILTLLFPNA